MLFFEWFDRGWAWRRSSKLKSVYVLPIYLSYGIGSGLNILQDVVCNRAQPQ